MARSERPGRLTLLAAALAVITGPLGAAASTLYLAGAFSSVGGTPAPLVASWNGSAWSAIGAGLGGPSGAAALACAIFQQSLYVGGTFSTAGAINASNVARWDSRSWHPVGLGVNGTIRAMAVFNGALYVGGDFVNAGGVPGTANLAAWNGATWFSVGGGVNGTVWDVRVVC